MQNIVFSLSQYLTSDVKSIFSIEGSKNFQWSMFSSWLKDFNEGFANFILRFLYKKITHRLLLWEAFNLRDLLARIRKWNHRKGHRLLFIASCSSFCKISYQFVFVEQKQREKIDSRTLESHEIHQMTWKSGNFCKVKL